MPRITKLLIANRGEIASRIVRSARELDIATVAVFSEPDASAAYVNEADECVALPGSAAVDSYLRQDLIVDAARRTGAQAVHPGYGFLSENADFAQACEQVGLIFVGPPPGAIRLMGSKTAAKKLMADAGVPVLPGLLVSDDGELTRELADRAAVEIGFPLLVKAAYGGGGRGMRVATHVGELIDAIAGARREAAAAFGDGTVFLERLVQRPRHIEVQIFADTSGQVVHLYERECSIQRRYQKIIEECPSPLVDDAMRAELGLAAVTAAKAIGYVGAGTVEFIVDATGEFFFLEVNTRLQVEHPVTEMVTGLDLVALQLAVAEGRPLPPEVTEAKLNGHAIEARLYAEDVASGYLPASGTLTCFEIPIAAGVRIDAGYRSGAVVSRYYDPMLAKVIAHAPTRERAARLLARTLADSRLHGIETNRALLVGILRHEEFLQGEIDTGFLTRHDPMELVGADESRQKLHALAIALADQALRREEAQVLAHVPSGWRNVPNASQQVDFELGVRGLQVHYRLRDGDVSACVDGTEMEGRLWTCTPCRVDIEVNGIRSSVSVGRAGEARYADSGLGSSTFVVRPRFPAATTHAAVGSLVAPMPGTVVRLEAEVGADVAAGQVLVVLEAMKMEHVVRAPYDGVLAEAAVVVGQSVNEGAVLAVVDTGSETSDV
jgi:acetyl/propionyl-CoA carboxylase alpha subunit